LRWLQGLWLLLLLDGQQRGQQSRCLGPLWQPLLPLLPAGLPPTQSLQVGAALGCTPSLPLMMPGLCRRLFYLLLMLVLQCTLPGSPPCRSILLAQPFPLGYLSGSTILQQGKLLVNVH
jgi:hypothetical protein